MYVVGNDVFAQNIAKELGVEYIPIETRIFLNREICPKIMDNGERLNNEKVLLVIRTKSGKEYNANKLILETYLTAKTLSGIGSDVELLLPWFAYSLQDKVFMEGESLSAKYVLDLFRDAGVKRFFTVSSHMNRKQGKMDYYSGMECHTISAFPVIGEYVKENYDFSNPLVISPDFTSDYSAKEVRDIIGGETTAIHKKRDLITGELTVEKHGINELKERDVVIVDDIASGGGTLTKAIKLCKENNAGRILCAVVHPVLAGECLEKVSRGGEFIACNTIDSPISKISVEKRVANYIKGLGN